MIIGRPDTKPNRSKKGMLAYREWDERDRKATSHASATRGVHGLRALSSRTCVSSVRVFATTGTFVTVEMGLGTPNWQLPIDTEHLLLGVEELSGRPTVGIGRIVFVPELGGGTRFRIVAVTPETNGADGMGLGGGNACAVAKRLRLGVTFALFGRRWRGEIGAGTGNGTSTGQRLNT